MKKIMSIAVKVVLTTFLMGLPILSIRFASLFVNVFCPYFGYEKMKIESNFIPRVVIIMLVFSIVCLFKLWVPSKER